MSTADYQDGDLGDRGSCAAATQKLPSSTSTILPEQDHIWIIDHADDSMLLATAHTGGLQQRTSVSPSNPMRTSGADEDQ